MNKVFIMGGSGTVGSALLQELKTSNLTLIAGSRTIKQISKVNKSCIEWAEFDLKRPETFEKAIKGCKQFFMISAPGDEEAELTAQPLLETLINLDLKHITYLSAMGAEQRPEFSTRKVERLIEKTGISYTFLRPNFFMQIFTNELIAKSIKYNKLLTIPASDAKLSFIDAKDVAGVAAEVIKNPKAHKNTAYPLTGSESIDHNKVTHYIAKATAKKVKYQPMNPETFHNLLSSAGVPEKNISRLNEMYRLVRAGKCEPITPDAELILKRPLKSFKEFTEIHKTHWL